MNYLLEPEYTPDGSRILYEIRTYTETTEDIDRQLTDPHTNSLYEIVYPKEACLRFQIEQGDICELQEEDIILIFPHVIHSSFLPSQGPGVTQVVQHVFKLAPAFLYPQTPIASDLQQLLLPPRFVEKYKVFRKGTEIHEKLFRLLLQMEEEARNQAPGMEIALRGLYSLLYTFLMREFNSPKEPPSSAAPSSSPFDTGAPSSLPPDTAVPSPSPLDAADTVVIFKAIAYIEEHFTEPLSMQQVASRCNVNYYYFSRLFKQFTHSDFRNYLLQLRLNEAKRRLLQTDSSITTIAMECGFTATSHFIQKFRQSAGVTPLEFRRQYRK